MTSTYRVAHLLASNFFGGPEKQLVEHAARIKRRSFEPLIISFLEGGCSNQLLDRARERGIATDDIDSKCPFDPRQLGEVIDRIRQNKIDLLCAHGYKANVIGRLASWWTGVPLTVISRGWTGENSKIRLYEWLDRLFLHLADHIIAVSANQLQRITRLGVAAGKISVVRNCIAVEKGAGARSMLREELGLPQGSILVISAGRLSPEKNYATMIAAAVTVCRRNRDAHFVVFGEGVLRAELEEKIAASGLGGRFLLPGFRNDLQALLSEIDIFVLPSFTEGLPNVVLEAFAAGKPVVATAVGGTPEVVEDGVSGFLTDPEQPLHLADCILRLTEDPGLREEMGQRGFEQVERNFSFEHQTDLYEELYLSLLKRKHGPKGVAF